MTVRYFGAYSAESKSKGPRSPMATFTRGLSVREGSQWKFSFPNGFGASVIDDGYGADEGLYELAVLGPGGHLTYDTPITDDVLGYLTEEQVTETLAKIEALTPEDIVSEVTRRANAERDAKIARLRKELAALEAEQGGAK